MIDFAKYHGTGNDFILLPKKPENLIDTITKICDRHFGIGSDGLIYPSESDVADIKMNYFNSNGSVAKMCGNGMRCFVKYCLDEGLINKHEFVVETLAGNIDIEVIGDDIKLGLGQPDYVFEAEEFTLETSEFLEEEVSIDGQNIRMSLVKVGTLHSVVFMKKSIDMDELGPNICHDELFPDDINVNFVEVIDEKTIKVTTYERGAGWTLSCGTGVSASAVISKKLNKIDSPVNVIVPGGKLKVFVDEDIKLQGPAVKIASGKFEV